MSSEKLIFSKKQTEKYKTSGSSEINIFVHGSTHTFHATSYSGARAFVSMESLDELIYIDYGGDLEEGEHLLTAQDLTVLYRDPPGNSFNRVTDGTLKVVVSGNTFKATFQNLKVVELDGVTTARFSGSYTINI